MRKNYDTLKYRIAYLLDTNYSTIARKEQVEKIIPTVLNISPVTFNNIVKERADCLKSSLSTTNLFILADHLGIDPKDIFTNPPKSKFKKMPHTVHVSGPKLAKKLGLKIN